MATPKDRLRILENIIGRVGLGGDVLTEYSKALSLYDEIELQNTLQPTPPTIPQTPPITEQNMI